MIATSNADGRPQSSIIFVKRDGDEVVFSTIKGRLKTRNMTRDPRVSLLCWTRPVCRNSRDRADHRGPREDTALRDVRPYMAAPRRRLSPAPSG